MAQRKMILLNSVKKHFKDNTLFKNNTSFMCILYHWAKYLIHVMQQIRDYLFLSSLSLLSLPSAIWKKNDRAQLSLKYLKNGHFKLHFTFFTFFIFIICQVI